MLAKDNSTGTLYQIIDDSDSIAVIVKNLKTEAIEVISRKNIIEVDSVTVRELAIGVGCHIQTIYKGQARGWIKKMSGSGWRANRYDESEVLRWLSIRNSEEVKMQRYKRPAIGWMEYFTDEAARYLQISVHTFKYYVRTKKILPARKEKHRLIFTKEELDKFKASRK